ncbi:MAG: tetratricopeptide repeat protein [Balneolaceae bacterium]|nr:tetratricopeptide repeat protein [Balneolaceae bacterium]
MRILLAVAVLLFTVPLAAEAQDEPPHGMGELEAYSIFTDAYRTGDYELAIQFGEWMLEAKPETIPGHDGFSLERTFNRMISVYVSAAEDETDPSVESEYLESAEEAFQTVFENFDNDDFDEFQWQMRLGRFYHEHSDDLDAGMEGALTSYRAMYELDPERFATDSDGFYARVLLTEYASRGDREDALEIIDEIELFAGVDLEQTIGDVREALFENPEERIEFIESRLVDADEAEREEMLQDLAELYEETGQTEEAAETARELYEMNPDFENTRTIAELYLADGNYRDALGYLKEAKESAEYNSDRKELALEVAESYQQLDEYPDARTYAQKAIDIDSQFGEAYMRMSAIYAGTISQCTGGETLDREDRTVYWLVLDYLDKAKDADPSLASTVDSRIESYEEAMPSSEDKFFSDWEDGMSFQIDGELSECYAWIDETTTVR